MAHRIALPLYFEVCILGEAQSMATENEVFRSNSNKFVGNPTARSQETLNVFCFHLNFFRSEREPFDNCFDDSWWPSPRLPAGCKSGAWYSNSLSTSRTETLKPAFKLHDSTSSHSSTSIAAIQYMSWIERKSIQEVVTGGTATQSCQWQCQCRKTRKSLSWCHRDCSDGHGHCSATGSAA